MIKDEINSLDDIAFQAEVGKGTASMFLHMDGQEPVQRPDYDPETIESFDRALEAVGRELVEVADNLANLTLIQRLVRGLFRIEPEATDGKEEAVYYGCFFGEMLVRNHGWAWVNDPERGYLIEKHGKKVQPDVLVLRRLTSLEQGMIVRAYQELAAWEGSS